MTRLNHPWRNSLLNIKQTTGLASICLQTGVNDHSASYVASMWLAHRVPSRCWAWITATNR